MSTRKLPTPAPHDSIKPPPPPAPPRRRTRDHDADFDIIGSKPTPAPDDLGPLFSAAARGADPSDNAARAAATDDAEQLLAIAEIIAGEILARRERVAMWEVRVEMARRRILANDGNEKLDALGALGRRMGLVAIGAERAPAWAQKILRASHANRHTVWARRRAAA